MHTNMSHVTHMNASCSNWNRCIHTKWLEHSRTRTHTHKHMHMHTATNKQTCTTAVRAHTRTNTHSFSYHSKLYRQRIRQQKKSQLLIQQKQKIESETHISKSTQKYMYKCKHTQKLFVTYFFCMHFYQKPCKSETLVGTRVE